MPPRKILVLRFSAMGDVAMTAPILRELTEQHPGTELIVVSRALFEPFFNQIPNLTFHPIDPKGKHQGLSGLYSLFKELKPYRITAVADLHQSLRSRVLTALFKLSGIRTASIDKGRGEKKALIRQTDKKLAPLKPTIERYADVFRQLGLVFTLKNELIRNPEKLSDQIIAITGPKNEHWIGISPFAQHAQKVYPLEKMEKVIAALAEQKCSIFIFGGGTAERQIAEKWSDQFKNVISTISKLNLNEELSLIANLDVMLSMDSAGMHMASLKGTPVVSVWGATHPFAGFLGYGQSLENCVQLDLYCRPCSIYGNKPCYRGDFACMNQLEEVLIIKMVIDNIS